MNPLKRFAFSAMLLAPAAAFAQISININIAPPALPVYEQPPVPAEGYIWTPGYWSYGDEGYYWVPGTWVQAPQPGLLWTPGYWGWNEGAYVFHGGYWGEHIGFYGGVNYGFGYGGSGYEGGRWDGGHFTYNTAVNNVNTTVIHNTYHTTVINNVTVNNVSYNGGTGGVRAQPSATEQAAANERHVEPTSEQQQHLHAASSNKDLLASHNHGSPAIAATAKPGEFSGSGVVRAKPAADRPEGAEKPAAGIVHNPETGRPETAGAGNAEHPQSAPRNPAANAPHPAQAGQHPARPAQQAPHPAPAHRPQPERQEEHHDEHH